MDQIILLESIIIRMKYMIAFHSEEIIWNQNSFLKV